MKLQKSHLLALSLFVVGLGQSVWGQTVATSTGQIISYMPGKETLIFRDNTLKSVQNYQFSTAVVVVDGAGKTIKADMIRPGRAATVYYTKQGNVWVVSKVVMSEPGAIPKIPTDASREPVRAGSSVVDASNDGDRTTKATGNAAVATDMDRTTRPDGISAVDGDRTTRPAGNAAAATDGDRTTKPALDPTFDGDRTTKDTGNEEAATDGDRTTRSTTRDPATDGDRTTK